MYILNVTSSKCYPETKLYLKYTSLDAIVFSFSNFISIFVRDLIFRVFDLVGNEVHREVISINEGLNNHEFDGSRLANGIYMYTLEKDGALVSDKMIINR